MAASAAIRRLLRRGHYEVAMRGFDLIHGLGLGESALRDRPGARILIYHGLDKRGGSGFNTRFTGVAEFERQVAWMSTHFRIVSLDQYFAGVRDPVKLTVVLTFDDGYASWLDLALPVLERYQAPAAFFVCAIRSIGQDTLWPDRLDIAMHRHRAPVVIRGETFEYHPRKREHVSTRGSGTLKARCKHSDWSLIEEALGAFPGGSTEPLPEDLAPYWRMLDEAGLRRLAASPLATIGSHGVRHLTLPHQAADVARTEMAESKRWLEAVIERPVKALAFPDGAWNRDVVAAAAESDYTQLFGGDMTADDVSVSPLLRARFTMNPFISWENQVRCIYSGGY